MFKKTLVYKIIEMHPESPLQGTCWLYEHEVCCWPWTDVKKLAFKEEPNLPPFGIWSDVEFSHVK
ncbi:Hypothetical protein KNT65_gp218 [Escherichia phage EcS1]|uniref:Uncharacterized protein n=1 Tax=Escherichia phage EcS1 TaxID=2083276 RepID=A0A2Z5ZCR9_9CAUD|nr:Hypothetical protein KNT65_gp218 [Escherichia phage EcS1]BBC78275.1 Hypothetical protein [Escherichia phage EcS1]